MNLKERSEFSASISAAKSKYSCFAYSNNKLQNVSDGKGGFSKRKFNF